MPDKEPAKGEKWIESTSVNAKLGSERCKVGRFYKGTPARMAAVQLAPKGTFRVYSNLPADVLQRMKDRGRVIE
jgi:hypothetical protein